ncbi:ImuA family protein [Dongia sp.]|uniref:ImuA family protein n=1 Tax=Dongia sp. TaxID=1977262 RepID=UPI0035ADC4B2
MKNEAAPHPSPDARPGLSALKRRIALLERAASPQAEEATAPTLAWGIESIDRHLPGGGLGLGALHEIAGAGADLEEASLAAVVTARLLGRAQRGRSGHALWIARQRDLYARALPASSCDPARFLHLHTRRNEDTLWAIEEALRCRGLVAVIGEVGMLDLTQSRRLQLAAEKSGVPAFIIRRGRNAVQARSWAVQPIAAHTRWRIHPAPSIGIATHQQPLPGTARWQIELWRCRGGRPGSWLVEETEHGWREATLPLPVAAALAERPLVAASDTREPKLKAG